MGPHLVGHPIPWVCVLRPRSIATSLAAARAPTPLAMVQVFEWQGKCHGGEG